MSARAWRGRKPGQWTAGIKAAKRARRQRPTAPGAPVRISDARVAEIVASLNDYETAHPHAMSSDVWQDVVERFPEYDYHATHEADIADDDMFLLTDGTIISWYSPERRWMSDR